MCAEIFIRVVSVFTKTIFTRRCKMQNNCNNWFHLPPHFGYIQPASAPPQPFIQQLISRTPIETQQAEECSNSKGDRITKTREFPKSNRRTRTASHFKY